MSDHYRAIDWNRQKRRYDGVFAISLLVGIGCFLSVTALKSPESTVETLILRSASISSFLLLHIILCIGPLARLNPKFLPLLYNRRHLGVTMFLLALVHGVLAVIQFHALGNENPLVSVLTSYQEDYRILGDGHVQLEHLPFEPFGVLALTCLFFLAALSHDFWLKQLGAGLWKAFHLLVYPAYVLVVAHVSLGAIQSERSPIFPALLALGFVIVTTLHLLAARPNPKGSMPSSSPDADGFCPVGSVGQWLEGRPRVVQAASLRMAVVRHQGRLFATSNVCRHQGGPLGEGRIIDGCLTCPWHGWNYQPHDGCSPPPFKEVIVTYPVRVVDGGVWVHPKALPPGTVSEGALVEPTHRTSEAPLAT